MTGAAIMQAMPGAGIAGERAASAGKTAQNEKLRAACNELLGMTMFSKMLQQARSSTLSSDLMNSKAQKVFQGQLDEVMLKNASAGAGGGLFGDLGDALFRDLGGTTPTSGYATLDLEA